MQEPVLLFELASTESKYDDVRLPSTNQAQVSISKKSKQKVIINIPGTQ